MKKFVIYYRVSKDTQKRGMNALSLEAQHTMNQRYLANLGEEYTVLGEFKEIITGTGKKKRAEFEKAVLLAKKENATILVATGSRLMRHISILTYLLESKVNVVSADSPNDDEFITQIKVAVWQKEAKDISIRTTAALAELKKEYAAQGKKLGNPRYEESIHKAGEASKIARNDRANEFAQKIGVVIKAFLFDSPNGSLRDIAKYLNDAGMTTIKGTQFTPTAVSRIMKRLNLK